MKTAIYDLLQCAQMDLHSLVFSVWCRNTVECW